MSVIKALCRESLGLEGLERAADEADHALGVFVVVGLRVGQAGVVMVANEVLQPVAKD